MMIKFSIENGVCIDYAKAGIVSLFTKKKEKTCSYMNNIQDDSYIKEIYLDLALEKSMLVVDAQNENATLAHGSESDEEARRWWNL
jgi:hypothetical protein